MLTSGSAGAGTSSGAPSIGVSGRAGPLEAIIGCDPCDARSPQLIRAFRPASIPYHIDRVAGGRNWADDQRHAPHSFSHTVC